jgi:hypothetical protein
MFNGQNDLENLVKMKRLSYLRMKEKQILYMKFLLNLNKILKSKRVQKYLADLNKKVTALL